MSGACASLAGSVSPAASHLDTQTLTTGSSGTAAGQDRRRGFITTVIGSLSDATSNLYAGAAIDETYWDENGGGGFDFCRLKIDGVQANSGWTTLTGNSGLSLLRADASFSTAGSKSTWTWNNYNGGPVNNPFNGSPILYFD